MKDSNKLCTVGISHFEPFADFTINDFELDASPGECIHISGSNGSGKTTLLTFLAMSAGQDRPIINIGPNAKIRQSLSAMEMVFKCPDVAFLFQTTSRNLVATNGWEDMAINLMNEGVSSFERRSKTSELLGMNELTLRKQWRELSGGWQQLVALAASTVCNRQIYLLDEPLSNLDDPNYNLVVGYIKNLCERGACVILTTHKYLPCITKTVSSWVPVKPAWRSSFIDTLFEAACASLEEQNEVHLRCEGITKNFGPQKVLQKVTYETNPGTVSEIVAKNGKGKSTFAKIISGVLKQDEGVVKINGQKTVHQPGFISYGPQNPLFALLGRNLAEDIKFTCNKSIANKMIEHLGDCANLPSDSLSYGELKLFSSILAVLSRPLAVLDEPFAPLDSNIQKMLISFLMDAASLGRSIVCFHTEGNTLPETWKPFSVQLTDISNG